MSVIDFEQEFEKFVAGNESSAIKDIYKIIPALSQEQMEVIHQLEFYINRYDLHDLKAFVNQYLLTMNNNKNLNIMNSINMKNLLRAYTQDELIRGIKIQSNSNNNNA